VKQSEATAGEQPELDGPSSEPTDLRGTLHEVSNALTVVLGWLQIASERGDGPVREAIERAASYARLGHGIARGAIGADSPNVDTERSATSLARDAVLAVTPEAERKQVQLKFESTVRGGDSVTDAPVVVQILLNLLLNAVAFTPEGGTVTLSLVEREGGLAFEVVDQGPGIPDDRASGIFGDGITTREGGAGVGLRYSRALAMRSGGSLSLARTMPSACFELRWPRSNIRSGARHPSIPPPGLAGSRILLLEDDAAVVDLIALALESRGVEVVSVTSKQALAELEQGRFAAALLDLSPIADDPRSALTAVERVAGPIPIVLISGSATGIPDSVKDDVKAWVRKPFEMGEVIEVLSGLITPA
jgi:CheY-like chemotaxis protein